MCIDNTAGRSIQEAATVIKGESNERAVCVCVGGRVGSVVG